MNPRLLGAYALEFALNRALRLDPDAPARLAPLADRIIAVHVEGTGLDFALVVQAGAVEILEGLHEAADVHVSGPPLALLRAAAARPGQGLPREVSVSGDAQLAQYLAKALGRLDIDWEEQAARVVGDIAAHALGNTARSLGNWSRRSRDTLLLDLGEYLSEEAGVLPGRAELERFYSEVDQVRDDVERLEKRIARLAAAGAERGA